MYTLWQTNNNYGKPPYFMENSWFQWPCSIVALNYWRAKYDMTSLEYLRKEYWNDSPFMADLFRWVTYVKKTWDRKNVFYLPIIITVLVMNILNKSHDNTNDNDGDNDSKYQNSDNDNNTNNHYKSNDIYIYICICTYTPHIACYDDIPSSYWGCP